MGITFFDGDPLRIILSTVPNYSQVAIAKTICLYTLMMPLALPLVFDIESIPRYSRSIWCACAVILVVAVFVWEGTPELRTFDFSPHFSHREL